MLFRSNIDLIVRGLCSLRPGIPGLSENIHVRSIIGRFLEHSRVYYFRNDGKEEYYCSSADWMDRNLLQRVETCFPIEGAMRESVIEHGLKPYLSDNAQAWEMDAQGAYHRAKPRVGEPRKAAQWELLEVLSG